MKTKKTIMMILASQKMMMITIMMEIKMTLKLLIL